MPFNVLSQPALGASGPLCDLPLSLIHHAGRGECGSGQGRRSVIRFVCWSEETTIAGVKDVSLDQTSLRERIASGVVGCSGVSSHEGARVSREMHKEP